MSLNFHGRNPGGTFDIFFTIYCNGCSHCSVSIDDELKGICLATEKFLNMFNGVNRMTELSEVSVALKFWYADLYLCHCSKMMSFLPCLSVAVLCLNRGVTFEVT